MPSSHVTHVDQHHLTSSHATSPSSNRREHSDATYYLTLGLCLLTAFLFVRSVLPRIPRLFLRGRLRVRRIGLRGARGIEWRARGHKSSKKGSTDSSRASSTSSSSASDGLVIKIQHIYLDLNIFSRSPETQKSRKAWITIQLQGVGVRLPQSPTESDEEAQRKVEEDARQRAEAEERKDQEAQEAADKRLDDLVNGVAPAGQSGLRRPSLMSREPSDQGSVDAAAKFQQSETQRQLSWAESLRYRVLPCVRRNTLEAVRAILFVITSSLPALTSLIDVEVSRIEIYVPDAESVVRVDRAGVQLSMSLVSGQYAGLKNLKTKETKQPNPASSAGLKSMPLRLGTSARDAVTFVTAGLPAGRAGALLDVQGVQIFEAGCELHQAHMESNESTKSSFTKRWSGCAAPGSQLTSGSPPSVPSASRGRRLVNNCIDWADWGMESSHESSFSAETGWQAGRRRSAGDAVPKEACLLEIQDTTKLDVGLFLGPSLRLGGKEAVEVQLDFGHVEVGLDAIYRVVRIIEDRKAVRTGPAPTVHGAQGGRSGLSKHIAQQRKSPAAKALASLRSSSVNMPHIAVKSHVLTSDCSYVETMTEEERGHLPKDILFEFVVRDVRFSIGSSNPQDDLHQRWLGTCGLKHPKQATPASWRQPGTSSSSRAHHKAEVLEHRRAFQIDGSIRQIDITCGINSGAIVSHVLHLGQFKIHSRSTWTPFGIFALADGVRGDCKKFFSGDANEETLFAEISLEKVQGDVKLDSVSAILSFIEMRRAERRSVRKDLNIDRDPARSKVQLLDHVPRLAVGLDVQNVLYRIDSDEASVISSSADRHDHRYSSLIFRMPQLHADLHGSYRDSYKLRSEADRRAAWKALKNDELEWSVNGDYCPRTSGVASPKRRMSNFSAFVDRFKGQLSPPSRSMSIFDDTIFRPQTRRAASPIGSPRSVSPMNLNPFRKEVASPQHEEPSIASDEVESKVEQDNIYTCTSIDDGRPARLVRVPTRLTRRATGDCELERAILYDFESHLSCPTIETFFVFSGNHEDTSCSTDATSVQSNELKHDPSRPQGDADHFGTEEGSDEWATNFSRRQLLAINNIDLSVEGVIPGKQDLSSERATLKTSDHQSRIKGILEEIDIELWHPRVIEVLKKSLEVLPGSRASTGGATNKTTGSEHDSSPAPLIDRLPGTFELWMSVGGLMAHIGGNDPNCDPHLSRGVGLEAGRIVAEFVSASNQTDHLSTRQDWGARSALMLAEDVKVSAQALAARHSRAAIAKVSFFELGLFPLLDVERATQLDHESGKSSNGSENHDQNDENTAPAEEVFADAVWDFQHRQPAFRSQARKRYHQEDKTHNFVLSTPYAAIKASIFPPEARTSSSSENKPPAELVIQSEGTNLLSLKVELLQAYCVLVAVAAMKSLKPVKQKAEPKESSAGHTSEKEAGDPDRERKKSTSVELRVSNIHVYVNLPESVKLFLHLRRVDCKVTDQSGIIVKWESLMTAVESPRMLAGELWEEAARLRDWQVHIPREKGPSGKPMINITGDAGSIRVPYGYVVHNIIDSTSVAFKATKQLVHQFMNDYSTESIITPFGEDPKHLPHINLRLRTLTIEAQDDPIETRLNIIWRAGRDENRARLDREEAFDAKVAALSMKYDQANSSRSSVSSSSRSSTQSDAFESDSDSSDDTGTDDGGSIVDDRKRRRDYKHFDVDLWAAKAKEELATYNSSSWIRRYANARAEQGRREEVLLKATFGRSSAYRHPVELPISMAQPTRAAPLFRSTMSDLEIIVGPPSFSEHHLRDWIHSEGKGTPRDLPYSLLVPFNIEWKMGEWRWDLRDYPMPLLHFPPADKASRSPEAKHSFRLKADLCIAEHLSEGQQSIRHVPAVVVPAACGRSDAKEYGINVPKVAMPVKIYGSPEVTLTSQRPTRLCWGQSIQPAIADMVRVFDGISSPPHDPSPKPGFWDKLPLILQMKWLLRWKGSSELHIHLKGSRDPYSIIGNGAGWVKCWRGDVEIRLGWDNEDGEFLQVISDEYLLAIPDLRGYTDLAATGIGNPESDDSKEPEGKGQSKSTSEHTLGNRNDSLFDHKSRFTKVCLRLSNGVRWGASLRHEHTCRDGICPRHPQCQGANFYRDCRFFERRPHWEVIQRSREYMDTLPPEKRTDSFYGWRSDFMHLGISIYSPKDGLTAYGKHRGQSGHSNNLYFSPLAWQHFWAWMRLFDSAMALPIRQGQLFPNAPPPSPKFGRHLGTIKYRFDIAPLFIAHLYTQSSKADWARGLNTMLGIKARLDVFHVDMHQRLQEMIKERPELQEAKTVFHKPFYEAEADFAGIDLRTLVGRFHDSTKKLIDYDDLDAEADENLNFLSGENPSEEDNMWIDFDDFAEVDYTPSTEETPEIRLIQALTCPHFNFYRRYDSQTERQDKNKERREEDREDAGLLEKTKFGNELEQTHTCLIGQGPKHHKVQLRLAEARLAELQEGLDQAPSKLSRVMNGHSSQAIVDDIETRMKMIKEYTELLEASAPIHETNNKSQSHLATADAKATHETRKKNHVDGATSLSDLFLDWETFDDRFLIHNPTFFLSNQTRLILLRYYASSKRRKSLIHHMTARAIWNIRQLNKNEDGKASRPRPPRHTTQQSKVGSELLTGLLSDTMQYVMADEDAPAGSTAANAFLDTHVDPTEGISDDFKVRRSNVCAFLKPQFVMTSQVDEASTVIITAVRMRLRNFAVLDPTVSDEDAVNGRVLSRNYFSLDGLQAFHPTSSTAALGQRRHRSAGCAISVPLETLIDLRQETRDFDRIVSRTDASVRYDKFNRLRLHDSSKPVAAGGEASDASTDHLRHYMDLLRVRCPRFGVSASSTHFGALYNIVTDLILYRDPAWREHAKQLETTLLSHDFKDVNALADAVADLQLRIRRILECDEEYQFHFDDLNEKGREEYFRIKAEMLSLAQKLLLLAEAITASEDSKGDNDKDKKSALRMEAHAQDLSWNIMGESQGELLAKLSIKRPSFTWLNKADNSAANSLSIVDLSAVDVRPEAHFAEIISKWTKAPDHPMAKQRRFVNAVWSELAPVGGISIVDQFELDLHPLKVQLEMKVGKMIMDYVFGSRRNREKEDNKRKAILDAQAKKSSPKSKSSPFARLTSSSKQNGQNGASTPDATSRRTSSSSDVRPPRSSRGMASESSGQNLEPSRPASIRGEQGSDEDEREDSSPLAMAKRNAAEMRKRASSNLTFVFFKLPETVFCLSYKGDKDKSITDVYDLVFRAPNIEYRNRTWGYEELVQHMKKDIFRAAWGQKTTILKSILSHRPRRPEALRNIREKQALLRKASREHRSLSPLQLQVHPPTPQGSRDFGTAFNEGLEMGIAQGASLTEYDSDDDEGEVNDIEDTRSEDLAPVHSKGSKRLAHASSHDRLGVPNKDGPSTPQSSSRLSRFLHDKLGGDGSLAKSPSRNSASSDERGRGN
ncbi:unnamed protein product [Sympodiomycopsis kandeliae]